MTETFNPSDLKISISIEGERYSGESLIVTLSHKGKPISTDKISLYSLSFALERENASPW